MRLIGRKTLLAMAILALLPIFSACREKEEASVDIVARLQDVSRLELAEMTVGKVGMISDPELGKARNWTERTAAMINSVKIGKRIGVYSYDTYVVAYIDLSRLSPEDVVVDDKEKTAHVTLPPVEVMTDGREPQLHEDHYRVTGLRSSISPQERAALKAQMAREVRKEIASSGEYSILLKEEARRKARAWFSTLLQSWGYSATVDFKN